MGRISEARVLRLERQTLNLHERLSALEARPVDASVASEPAASSPEAPATVPTAWRATPPAPPAEAVSDTAAVPASTSPPLRASRREGLDLEDLLGGRVLAWTGGIAVVAGIAFLLAIAVSRGWIGPSARTLLAGVLSVALIGAGAWLYERRGRTDAALATLSAGIAGLFCTVAVGGPVYGVLPAAAALALAFATGALATAFAVRWQSRGIGALGIVGALIAPVLAGAPSTTMTLTLLWLAAASGAAVLVSQRWNWLAVAVFTVPAGQWLWWLAFAEPDSAAILLVLCAFGALNVAAAVGFELRVPAARLRASSALLLTTNAMTLALAGWFALDGAGSTTLGRLWICALAATHLSVGMMTRSTRVNRDVRLLALVLGVVLADVAAGLLLEGAVLAGAFAVTTAGLGLLARRRLAGRAAGADDAGRDATLLSLGLGGHLLLTSIQALTQMPPDAVAAGDAITFGGYAAVAVTACAAFVAGRFVEDVRPRWRLALDVVAMSGAAYLTTAALDGSILVAAFAAQAAALGAIAARERDAVAGWGGGAYLALALGHAVAFEAPPEALVVGLSDVPGAALALFAGGAAALLGARQLGRARRDGALQAGDDARALMAHLHAALGTTGAVVLLYLASTALVTGFQPGSGAATAGLLDLGVRELGQLLLSGLWAITGVTALVIGLRRDERALRLGSLALLMVTVGKVFLYDLAALTSLYRVGSFIGLGLLLLIAAGIWQRMRPRPLADLRETPEAVR